MTRLVPLSQLTIECSKWSNPRVSSGLNDAALKELADSIKTTTGPSGTPGPLSPPIVQRVIVDGEEINLVINGQRRVLGSFMAFPKNHQIDVIDLSPEALELTNDVADELTLKALTIDNQRANMSSWELSEAAERLRNRGRTLDVIGHALGRSESWVSKILKARMGATKDLMAAWKAGRITDEQFKDLAKMPEKFQEPHVQKVVKARESDDKSEARAIAKEATAKASKGKGKPREKDAEVELERRATDTKTDKTEAKNGKSGPTEWKEPPPVAKPPSRVVLQQMLELEELRVPTDPYVKGIMDGVRYALDEHAIDDFGAAWRKYIARVEGSSATAKKTKGKGKSKKKGKK